jgi:hypothetical protein
MAFCGLPAVKTAGMNGLELCLSEQGVLMGSQGIALRRPKRTSARLPAASRGGHCRFEKDHE